MLDTGIYIHGNRLLFNIIFTMGDRVHDHRNNYYTCRSNCNWNESLININFDDKVIIESVCYRMEIR